jgi:formylglycine-generating enzyme required for sulfatase activity
VDFEALRLAVADLAATFGDRYPGVAGYLQRLAEYQKRLPAIREGLARGDEGARKDAEAIVALRREALLANPLLNFRELLVIRRKPVGDPRRAADPDRGIGKYIGLPQQSSWQLHTMSAEPWENEIAAMEMPGRAGPGGVPAAGQGGRLRTVFRPAAPRLVSDMDLHFDGGRILFSMRDDRKLWQISEVGVDGQGLRQVSRGQHDGVHNLDACYLPDGRIAFISTATFQGVPCNSGVNVGMMYLMDADGGGVRQLTFEQDHNFCPTVMNDGRILYLRWEYTDIPHVWARILFTMNPDGTGQREFYGSGSYWPNAIFYARPIPGHPTMVVGTVTGHHVGRIGQTVLFDPVGGRQAPGGVVQRIPGRGKAVEPVIVDKLTMDEWPKSVHPFPLSDPSTGLGAGKYFLVAAKPRPNDLWGIYLVDVFDNMLLLKEEEGYAFLEPIPLRAVPTPPVPRVQTDLTRADAVVYVHDVYEGPGLAGVPRGAVKSLRLFTYHFAYQGVAGINHRVGADGPWEPKRVLGTVPVEADGSAMFRVPANTPISIQPLDASGQAVQLMRSWMTAMPGEVVSCSGCHERQNTAPPNRPTLAVRKPAEEIQPWRGPVRGFSFPREVQPVLDRHCATCHNGAARTDGKVLPDLRARQGRLIALRGGDPEPEVIPADAPDAQAGKHDGLFDPSYMALRSYIRVGGLESDLVQLRPGEFAADTSELVQMLQKGHHGVRLDAESWDRLMTWIDLNAPCHGTWREVVGPAKMQRDHDRRRALKKLYAGIDEDPEVYPETPAFAPAGGERKEGIDHRGTEGTEVGRKKTEEAGKARAGASALSDIPSQRPLRLSGDNSASTQPVTCPGWPFDAAEAGRRQALGVPERAAGGQAALRLDLSGGVAMELVRVPAGQFVMGDPNGLADERPACVVRIDRAFWMGRLEVTNEQYGRFDADHDSRFEHKGSWKFSQAHLGWPLNGPRQPVVRVSWSRAGEFCRWLAARTGRKVALPTEAQWEYACRAGSAAALSFGGLEADFSPWANLADATIRQLAYDTDGRYTADMVPRDARFNDGKLVTADVGTYRPNAWGLHDMHGNVWEWTRSAYRPYPYRGDDGRNEERVGAGAAGIATTENKVVRGGSWRDRALRARSAFRLSYPQWRCVYNVGFRVVVEE